MSEESSDHDSVWRQQFLESIVQNIPNMVFVKEADELRFTLFNTAGEELLGLAAADLIGKNDFDFFPPQEAEFFTNKDREVLESGTLLDIESEPIQTAHQGSRILHTKKIPLFDDEGKPTFLLGISEDITDRVRAEEELRQARERAEAASKAKSEFLSRVSHELRTPLNAILGFAQLIEIDADERQLEYARHISHAGRNLLALVNDVLDIADIESGEQPLILRRIDLNTEVDKALHLVQPLAQKLGVDVPNRAKFEKRHWVMADQTRVSQILVNLLTNAIKYNRSGGTVQVTCEETDERIVLRVIDTGRGIDPQLIPELFLPFSRLGAETSGIEGTGLGLAVCQSVADQINASISVESEPGQGSTFTVEMAAVFAD